MRNNKLFAVLGVCLMVSPLAACAKDEESKSTILRVLNMEDYIYVQEEDEDPVDLTHQFEQYIANNPELHANYGDVEVIYDTTDTNETLYSEMQTGKALYDLMCPSDYMIQKLISSDMLVPLQQDLIPNYYGADSKASAVIKNIFDNLDGHIIKEDKDVKLRDYAVGYMWGTLGILFNPEYDTFQERGYSADKVIGDMTTWDVLWDEQYNNTISVKDSMRDTYAIGVIHTYLDEIQAARQAYEDDRNEETLAAYKAAFDAIFNRSDEQFVREVEQELNKLKDNVFGLEVDSGKQDIITGKIGINLAWSGDAVYSMDQGEDGLQVGENTKELCYSIPVDGSNLWFDAWVMPKLKDGDRSEEQFKLAHEFLNFICKVDGFTIGEGEDAIEYDAPVAQNMDYIGYTSFMGGDETLDLVREWYDVRYSEITEEVEVEQYIYEYYPVYIKLGDNSYSEEPLSFADCMVATHDTTLDTNELYYFVEGDEEKADAYYPVHLLDDEGNKTEQVKTYGDLLIADALFADPADYEAINDGVVFNSDAGIQRVDLSHYFEGTLDEYGVEDMYFYTETYYCIDEEGNASPSVGRQFYCQYPDMETLNRCSVMKDYGKNNEYVMQMWERFKSNSLPAWALILFIVEIAAILGLVAYFMIRRIVKKKTRIKRLKSQE